REVREEAPKEPPAYRWSPSASRSRVAERVAERERTRLRRSAERREARADYWDPSMRSRRFARPASRFARTRALETGSTARAYSSASSTEAERRHCREARCRRDTRSAPALC